MSSPGIRGRLARVGCKNSSIKILGKRLSRSEFPEQGNLNRMSFQQTYSCLLFGDDFSPASGKVSSRPDPAYRGLGNVWAWCGQRCFPAFSPTPLLPRVSAPPRLFTSAPTCFVHNVLPPRALSPFGPYGLTAF